MTVQEQIHDWCQEVLERKIDLVAFVDRLLALTTEFRQLRCTMLESDGLRLEFGSPPIVVEEVWKPERGRLRMMCARLAVLVSETDGQEFQPYGGAGFITRLVPILKGPPGRLVERQFSMRHQNSLAAPIEFTITAL